MSTWVEFRRSVLRLFTNGLATFMQKGLHLLAALLAVAMLLVLEHGNRAASTTELADVAAQLEKGEQHVVPATLRSQHVTSGDQAWELIKPFVADANETERKALLAERAATLEQLRTKLAEPLRDVYQSRDAHDELLRIDNAVRAVHAGAELRLAEIAAEDADRPPDRQRLPAYFQARERIFQDEAARLGELSARQQRVLSSLKSASWAATDPRQQREREIVDLRRAVDTCDVRLAALPPVDAEVERVHRDVTMAFAAAQEKKKIFGIDVVDPIARRLFARDSALHVLYDVLWYAALVIAVVAVSAFLFLAVFNILTLPKEMAESFDKTLRELLEHAPEKLRETVTADALKTTAASVVALVVGSTAVLGTAGHAGSSPQLEHVSAASVLTPADSAWSLPQERALRDGRDGAAGRDGTAARDGAAGRDGRDGKSANDGKSGRDGADGHDGRDGRDGRDGLQGPQGPGGQPPVDVWTASIRGLDARLAATEKQLADATTQLAKHETLIGSIGTTLTTHDQRLTQVDGRVAKVSQSVGDVKKSTDDLNKNVVAQAGMWDTRPWWYDGKLTAQYQFGPVALAALKEQLATDGPAGERLYSCIADFADGHKEPVISAVLKDRLETWSESQDEAGKQELRKRQTLIMDIARLPR